MPNTGQHHEQYKKNRLLLDSMVSDLTLLPEYPDWAITISFYSALHLIEKRMAELGYENATTDHQTREKMMYKVSEFKSIFSLYNTLKGQSYRARYQCCTFNLIDVRLAVSNLTKIETKYA